MEIKNEVATVGLFSIEFLHFFWISIKHSLRNIMLLFVGPLILRKDTTLYVIKRDNKLIGGFIVSSLPIDIVALHVFVKGLLNKKKRSFYLDLLKNRYKNITYLIIKKEYRGEKIVMKIFLQFKNELPDLFWVLAAEKYKKYYKSIGFEIKSDITEVDDILFWNNSKIFSDGNK